MKQSFFLATIAVGVAGAAAAQAPPAPATPPAQTSPPVIVRTNECTPMRTAPEKGAAAPESTTTGQRAEALGDKLARSDGVLCPPPGVDPEIHAPTPEAGKTPVIPPPGSPGGDPSLRPK